MTGPVEWSVARRIGFRFAIALGALLVFPFPLYLIPKLDWLTSACGKAVTWATLWFATAVLGLATPSAEETGSGDSLYYYVQLLLFVVLAALVTAVWSVVDRRRRSYPRLAAAARVVLRYYLAYMMVDYGVSKILKSQFYDLAPGVLHQRLGETPPMKLLWAFMGYSLPYTVFAGLAETVGGVLLLWRRTTMAGAVLVIAVMTNVVLLNLCYDVPVKLFSMQLLVIAVILALPDARRLLAALLGRAVGEVAPPPRGSSRRERARAVAKLLFIALVTFGLITHYVGRPGASDHRHELYGNWIVDRFVIDGVEHPPLTTDPVRWESWSANPTYMQIWFMTGSFEGRGDPERGYYDLEVDPNAHTIVVTVDDQKHTKETWHYVRPARDRLVIDAVHRGRTLHVELHLEPDGTLLTRGFHWINEYPFNR